MNRIQVPCLVVGSYQYANQPCIVLIGINLTLPDDAHSTCIEPIKPYITDDYAAEHRDELFAIYNEYFKDVESFLSCINHASYRVFKEARIGTYEFATDIKKYKIAETLPPLKFKPLNPNHGLIKEVEAVTDDGVLILIPNNETLFLHE